ncbi:hypothetical protein [Ruegeria sp. SCP11]|uniref:hypothetical protein n=1 Tax=Ruegeria sp. SCP11 TaxID=3141378 RepID=UPI003337C855
MTQTSKDADKPHKPVGIFWGYLLVAVSTAVAVIAILFVFATHIVDFSFVSDATCRVVSETRFYDRFTYCFYGSDWDEETYLGAVSGFYSTLVAVLVAVQALISWLAFTVIRSSNKQAISEEVEKEIPYFFRTKDADPIIQDALNAISYEAAKTALQDIVKDDTKATEELQRQVYEKLVPGFDGLRGDVEQLQAQFERYLEGDDADQDNGKIYE